MVFIRIHPLLRLVKGVYPTNGIPNPHSRTWDSPPVLDLFHQILADKAPEPFVCAAAADGDQATWGEAGAEKRRELPVLIRV